MAVSGSSAARRLQPRRAALLAAALACAALLRGQVLPESFAAFGVPRSGCGRQVRVARSASGGYTLRYFDGRGAAETVRLLFAVAGKDYEDKRYPFSFGTPGDFSTIKREEFEADRAAGKMDVAMGKVPVLEVGDSMSIPQSKAIERYLARQFGMMGGGPDEEVLVDAMAEHVRDINDAYARKGLFFMKDPEKKAELQKKWYGEELPPLLAKLDKALPGTSGFAVGDKVSLADVVIFKLLKDTYDSDVSAAYDSCSKLKAIIANIEQNESLKAWLEERPKTMF